MKVCGKNVRVDWRLIRVARLADEGFEFLHDPAAVIGALRKSEARIDLFTFTQEPPEVSPKHGYRLEWDELACLPVSTFEDWWNRQINPKTRNMVRRAQKKGVTVREVPFNDALVRGISEIYNESPIRQGKPFRHYGQDLESLRQEHATFLDRSIFLGAFFEEDLIGFVKLVAAQHHAALMQIVAMLRHREKAATNALIAQAVRSCAERGIPYLVYEKFSGAKEHHGSLDDFKRHNGFQRISLPRYYAPLTLAGRVALSFGLHHRFVDHVPESVLARLREIRNAWYGRKLQSVTEGS
jgi:hypothetical protein